MELRYMPFMTRDDDRKIRGYWEVEREIEIDQHTRLVLVTTPFSRSARFERMPDKTTQKWHETGHLNQHELERLLRIQLDDWPTKNDLP